MITELSLKNFKSWRHTGKMRMAPITGLFGTNSSGKTSILQLLLMLKQTVDSSDRSQVLNFGDERTPVSLGTFRDIVFRHEKPGRLTWSLRWMTSRPYVIVVVRCPPTLSFDSMSLGAEISENGSGRPILSAFEYGVQDTGIRCQRKGGSEWEYEFKITGNGLPFETAPDYPMPLTAPTKCYGFPEQVRLAFKNAEFFSNLELEFEKLMGRIYYLGPLRDNPKPEYLWAGASPSDMGRRGEKVIESLLALRERGETIVVGKGQQKPQQVEVYIASWLKKIGLIHAFTVKPLVRGGNLYRVRVRATKDSPEVRITDVGFGVSQVLPVIVMCFYVPEGSTVILEQPEIHLHPSVQEKLADILIDAVKKRGIQLIIESHSEHLLRRLQRRIAEEELKQEEVALYFTSMEGGESKLTPLDVDEYGNIRNWPKDFFGDDFGEIAETEKARLRRQIGKK